MFRAQSLAEVDLCSSLEPAAVTAADAFLHPSSQFFAGCSFILLEMLQGMQSYVVRISATLPLGINL